MNIFTNHHIYNIYSKNILQFDALKNLFLNIAALQIKKPIILTIRTAAEGGEIEIDPKDYFHVYELGIESKAFDIYDVELALGTNMAIELRTLIHDANNLSKKFILCTIGVISKGCKNRSRTMIHDCK